MTDLRETVARILYRTASNYSPFFYPDEEDNCWKDWAREADALIEIVRFSKEKRLNSCIKALEAIVHRCTEYEQINLVGKTPSAKKAGTLRNCLYDARKALGE